MTLNISHQRNVQSKWGRFEGEGGALHRLQVTEGSGYVSKAGFYGEGKGTINTVYVRFKISKITLMIQFTNKDAKYTF